MNATAAALVRANGVVTAACLRRHRALIGGHPSSSKATSSRRVTGALFDGGGGGASDAAGGARRVTTTARLGEGMDAKEAVLRGGGVADAELNPSTFSSLSKGEVPRSVDDAKVALKGMRYGEVEKWLTSIGEKPSRASQLFAWMYRRGKLAERVDQMEDVAAAFRDKLAGVATLEVGARAFIPGLSHPSVRPRSRHAPHHLRHPFFYVFVVFGNLLNFIPRVFFFRIVLSLCRGRSRTGGHPRRHGRHQEGDVSSEERRRRRGERHHPIEHPGR